MHTLVTRKPRTPEKSRVRGSSVFILPQPGRLHNRCLRRIGWPSTAKRGQRDETQKRGAFFRQAAQRPWMGAAARRTCPVSAVRCARLHGPADGVFFPRDHDLSAQRVLKKWEHPAAQNAPIFLFTFHPNRAAGRSGSAFRQARPPSGTATPPLPRPHSRHRHDPPV